MNTYLVSTLEMSRVSIIATIKRIDPEAKIRSLPNPCLFAADTKITPWTIDAIDGVAHVVWMGHR